VQVGEFGKRNFGLSSRCLVLFAGNCFEVLKEYFRATGTRERR
jgi:hypothetical protein